MGSLMFDILKSAGNVSLELVVAKSLRTFLGGFFKCWKKSFLST